MGRKKIQIAKITDERNRHVTFTKRRFGLMKKAYELSVLCDCQVALIVFNSSNKLFQFASSDMDRVLLKYTECSEPHENRTNADILDTLRKKGLGSGDGVEANDAESPQVDQKSCSLSQELLHGLPPSSYHPGSHPSPLLYSHQSQGSPGDPQDLLPMSHSSLQRSRMSPRQPSSTGPTGTDSFQGPLPGLMTPTGASRGRQGQTPLHRPEVCTLLPPSSTGPNTPPMNRTSPSQNVQVLCPPHSGFPGFSPFGSECSLGADPSCLSELGGSGLGPSWQQNLQHSVLARAGNLCQNSELYLHQNLHIKREPTSPPGDLGVGANWFSMGEARDPQGSGCSPSDSCGSLDHHGDGRFLLQRAQENQHSPVLKRVRLSEGWAT